MICPYCQNKAVYTENKAIYGKNYGKSYYVYLCVGCNAYVGVHENDANRPKGTLANAELRHWRKEAHLAIDYHWRSGKMSRKVVYKRLKKICGHSIHIGELGVKACKQLVELGDKIWNISM